MCRDKLVVQFTRSKEIEQAPASKLLSLSRKIHKKKKRPTTPKETQKPVPTNIFRINYVLLQHLLRSDFVSKALCSEHDPEYITVIESVLSSCLNRSSWKNSKTEEVAVHQILAQFGLNTFETNQGSRVYDYLVKLTVDHGEYFNFDDKQDKMFIKSKDLVVNFQTEFLENYVSKTLGKEALRVLKATELMRGDTQQAVQEFCLIQAKAFKKIVTDLLELNLLSKFWSASQ